MGVLVHAVQGRALLRGAVIREQGVRVAVQRMAGVTFHHDARLPRQAELCHQGVQIGGLVVDVGGQQHLAALIQVVLQRPQTPTLPQFGRQISHAYPCLVSA